LRFVEHVKCSIELGGNEDANVHLEPGQVGHCIEWLLIEWIGRSDGDRLVVNGQWYYIIVAHKICIDDVGKNRLHRHLCRRDQRDRQEFRERDGEIGFREQAELRQDAIEPFSRFPCRAAGAIQNGPVGEPLIDKKRPKSRLEFEVAALTIDCRQCLPAVLGPGSGRKWDHWMLAMAFQFSIR
jgi:hypothetical protein